MYDEHADDAPEETQVDIELDPEVAEGLYANLVMITHSSEEFFLDFIRVVPGAVRARVKSRIIITPEHARRLLAALADNIELFEHTHGPIVERTPPGGAIQFGGIGGEA